MQPIHTLSQQPLFNYKLQTRAWLAVAIILAKKKAKLHVQHQGKASGPGSNAVPQTRLYVSALLHKLKITQIEKQVCKVYVLIICHELYWRHNSHPLLCKMDWRYQTNTRNKCSSTGPWGFRCVKRRLRQPEIPGKLWTLWLNAMQPLLSAFWLTQSASSSASQCVCLVSACRSGEASSC